MPLFQLQELLIQKSILHIASILLFSEDLIYEYVLYEYVLKQRITEFSITVHDSEIFVYVQSRLVIRFKRARRHSILLTSLAFSVLINSLARNRNLRSPQMLYLMHIL